MSLKLNVRAFTFATGILWGSAMLFLGILATRGYGLPFVELFGSIYPGFKPTFLGTLLGTIWGVIDGCIAGVMFAWLYNHFF